MPVVPASGARSRPPCARSRPAAIRSDLVVTTKQHVVLSALVTLVWLLAYLLVFRNVRVHLAPIPHRSHLFRSFYRFRGCILTYEGRGAALGARHCYRHLYHSASLSTQYALLPLFWLLIVFIYSLL